MNNKPATVRVTCTECGELISISNKLPRVYCPVCASLLTFKDTENGILNSEPDRTDLLSPVSVICTECGARIEISNRSEYPFCPVCASKFSFKDAKCGLLSKDLIASISGEEFDRLIENTEAIDNLPLDRLTLAANRGSVPAAIAVASHYVDMKDYVTAKRYFELPAVRTLPDAEFGSLACSLKENCDSLGALTKIRRMDCSNFQYLSASAKQQLDRIIDDAWEVIRESIERANAAVAAAAAAERAAQSASDYEISSSYGGYPIYSPPEETRSFTQGGPTGCGIGGSFCFCGDGR